MEQQDKVNQYIKETRTWIEGLPPIFSPALMGAGSDGTIRPVAGMHDIRTYGAVGDGSTLNTEAIQAAIDTCAADGGGTVLVPAGRYPFGTIIIKSHVELHLQHGATLLCSTDVADVPLLPKCRYDCMYNVRGTRAFIYAESKHNIAVTGSGTIDGQGAAWTPGPHRGTFDERPRVILFVSCKDVRVEGIRLRNSPSWMQHYLDCDNVQVRGIDVFNHANLNCDGIDIDGCRNITLSDSTFDTDDDGITLKSTGCAPTENVVISNCVVSSFCNAIKAGTESVGGFRNIAIGNCVVKPSRSKSKPAFGGPRIGITGVSLIVVSGGTMEGVAVNNLVIEGTMAPLYVRLGNRANSWVRNTSVPDTGSIRNISISNVVAHSAGTWGSSITGIPGHPVTDVSLSNIRLCNAGGVQAGQYSRVVPEDEHGYPQPDTWGNLPAYGLYLRHVSRITASNLTVATAAPDERVPIWADDVQHMSIRQTRLSGELHASPLVGDTDLTDYDIEPPPGWPGQDGELVSSDR